MVIREIRKIEAPPRRKGVIREIRRIEAPPYRPGGTGIPPEPVAGFPKTPTTPQETVMKGTLIHEYTQRIEDIDPSAEYYLDETRKRTIKGQYLIHLLKQQQQRIKDYPRGTTFVKTPTGYRVIIPRETEIREPGGPLAGGLGILASPEIAYQSLAGTTWQPGRPLYSEQQWETIESKRVEIETQWEQGDVGGLIKNIVSIPVISAPLAYGFGFGLGLGFRGVGAASLATTGAKAKVLSVFATKGPWVAGGTISAVVGADIGKTAAYEEHGLVPPGTTVTKATLYGSQFYAAGLGAIRASTFKLNKELYGAEYRIAYEDGYARAIIGKKYINLFGKKLFYAKFAGLSKSGMIGFEPKPSYPYTPKGLSKAPTIYGHKPVGKPLVPISFKGKYHFITSEAWQPKEGIETIKAWEFFDYLRSKGLIKLTVGKPEQFPSVLPKKGVLGRAGWQQGYAEIFMRKDVMTGEYAKKTDMFADPYTVFKHEMIHIHEGPAKDEPYVHSWDKKEFPFMKKVPKWMEDLARYPEISAQLNIRKLPSATVYPKPKLYRSYETYFFVVAYQKPLFTITKKPVFLKPPIRKSVKDFVKPPPPDTIIKKGGKGQQIILEPPKVKTVQKDIVIEVPETLKKRIWQREPIQEVKPEQLQKFRNLKKTIYKQRVETQQKVEQAFGVIALQGQRQQFDRAMAFDRMLRFDTQQIFGQPQMIGQAVGQQQMKKPSMHQYFNLGLVNIIPYEQTREVIPIFEPTKPPPPPPPKIKPPRLFELPDGDGQQEQPSDLFARSYLVQTKIRTHYGGKKVKKDKWITKEKPLNQMDAMAYGAYLTENSAKASFRLVPSDRKPQKLSSRIPSWLLMGDQYYNRDNLFIEHNIHRINTPGEINQISRLGWSAPRKKRRRSRRKWFNV